MEYQKIINLLNNTPNQPTKYRSKNWVEINDDIYGTYSTNSQIKLKTSMIRPCLCDYSDAYVIVKGTIKVKAQAGDKPKTNGKKVVFKTCVPITDCISELNNTQIDYLLLSLFLLFSSEKDFFCVIFIEMDYLDL